jgi:hypothetical protein
VADPNAADAVLTGSVLKCRTEVTTFDSTLQRATGATAYVGLRVVLRERATNAVLYSASQLESRERYEVSADSRDYLDESDAAMARLSQSVARTVVSGILEKF